MTRNGSKRVGKIIATAASLALVLGLVPAMAFANPTLYTVTVNSGTADKQSAAQNETVTIKANDPASGMAFSGWNAVGMDYTSLGDPQKSTASFMMPGNDVTVTANYCKVLIYETDSSSGINNRVYTGNPQTPSLTVCLDGVDANGVGMTPLDAGYYTADYTDNINVGTANVSVTLKNSYMGSGSASFEITPASFADATVKVSNQVYDGTALEPAPEVTWHEKQVGADDYSATYTDNVRVGTATVTVTGEHNFKDDAAKTATFKITKRPVTITADSAEREYNSSPLTADGFSSEGLAKGDRVAFAKVEGSQTDVGSSSNTVSGAKIVNAAGDDVTDCYDITYKPGTLTVKPVYEAASGSGSTWVKHSAEALTFTFKRSPAEETTLDHFTGVLVDGTVVPPKNYSTNEENWTASKGSLILSLQPAFLETLSEGEHTVTAVFDDGSAEASFKVTSKAAPTKASIAKVGDVLPLTTVLLAFLLSAAALAISRARMQSARAEKRGKNMQ